MAGDIEQSLTTAVGDVFRRIDATETRATLEALERRIDERFPGSNLARVCAELIGLARESRSRVVEIPRPYYGLRIVPRGSSSPASLRSHTVCRCSSCRFRDSAWAN